MRKTLLVAAALVTAIIVAVLWFRPNDQKDPQPNASENQHPTALSQQSVLPDSNPHSPGFNGPAASATLPRSREELRSLLAAIHVETDPGRRSDLLRQLLAQATGDAMPFLLENLKELGGGEDIRAELLFAWTRQDPQSATAWATNRQSLEDRISSIQSIATAQADTDLPRALKWLETIPSDDLRSKAAAAVSYEAARIDPLTALRVATELPAGSTRDDLAIRAVKEWAATDPKTAAEWALGITDESLRHKSVAEAASVWGTIDPAAAAAFATANLPPNETLSNVAADIVQSWAATSPREAAAWVALFPEGDLRNTALHSVISQWTATSPSAVSSWIEEQPVGNLKDRGISEYALALAEKDPVGAIPILQGVSDTTLRSETTEVVLEKWLTLSPAAARTWIDASHLDPAVKTRLLNPTPNDAISP